MPVGPAPAAAQILRPERDARRVAALRHAAGWAGASIGSSAWVVAGALTARGRPLLAADAHLQPLFPSHFYQVDLAGGELGVAGATLPGVPLIWTGFNARVSWASTASAAVVADLFEETLNAQDPARSRRWQWLAQARVAAPTRSCGATAQAAWVVRSRLAALWSTT